MSNGLNLVKNCTFALLPQCEAYKNKENRNTGFALLYNGSAATSKITGGMINMASNFGYYWDSAEWVYRFDGVNDYIHTNFKLSLANNSVHTFSIENTISSNNSLIIFAGYYEDNDNYWYFGRNTSNKIILAFKIAGTFQRATSNESVLVGTTPYLSFTKNSSGILSLYINGVEVTYLNRDTYTLGSKTFNFNIGKWNNFYNSGNLKRAIYCETLKTVSEILNEYNLGPDLGGLRGIPYSDGTMSFLEERTGLYDTHKNVVSLISSSIPRASDFNTGLIPLIQGPESDSTITGTLTNFGVGDGFIAKSGGTPAHVSFNGVDSSIVLSDHPMRGISSLTISGWFNFDTTSGSDVLYSYGMTGIDHYISLERAFVASANRIYFSVSDGTANQIRVDVTLTPGTWYHIAVTYQDSDADIYINGDLVTLNKTGSLPSNTSTNTFTSSHIGSFLGAFSVFGGKMRDISIDLNAKSPDWIKDQYYSSQNEWQQDLSGEEPAIPDGTMTVSAEHEYLDAQFCWLQYSNFNPIANAWGTGQKGLWKRQVGLGFVSEILARWDLSAYVGMNLESAKLLSYSDDKGVQISSATSSVYEQNKAASSTWANGTDGPPIFDDFNPASSWNNTLDSLTVQNSGQVYVYDDVSGNIKDLAQDWIDSVKDQDDGLIIDADFRASNWYLDVFNVKLGIKLEAVTAISTAPPPYIFKLTGGL